MWLTFTHAGGQRGAARPHARPAVGAALAGRADAELRADPRPLAAGERAADAHPAAPAGRRAFARGHVERLRPRVAELAERLADDVADAGADGSPVDLIALYAEPLPVQVIAELLGVPGARLAAAAAVVERDREDVRVRGDARAARGGRDGVARVRRVPARAGRGCAGVRRATTWSPRSSPRPTPTARRLTEDELVTTCTLLLNAGHEATVNVVGNGVTALLSHPDELAALRADPALVPSAVEELIRYDSPLQLFERTAVADTRVGDVVVEAGTKIAALLGAANRDPAVFADPDRFDVARADNPHLGFGAGIHFCVGAPLARVELQASLRTLLRRFPALALAADAGAAAGVRDPRRPIPARHRTGRYVDDRDRLAGAAPGRARGDGPRLRAVLAVPGRRGGAGRRRPGRHRLQRRERLVRARAVRRVRAGVGAARQRRRAARRLRLRRLRAATC